MDRYCPECNSTMTPSLVGYLCSECGHMQRFYAPSPVVSPSPTDQPAYPAPQTPLMSEDPVKNDTPEQRKIRSTLKRLMVPELSPPHHHQIIADESSSTNQAAVAGHNKSKIWPWLITILIVATISVVAAYYLLYPNL